MPFDPVELTKQIKAASDAARLTFLGAEWVGREMLAPCFAVNVVGTTGSGDCTIAGFLAGLLKGLPPEQVMTAAVGVGAFNVEVPDAVSGVPSWETLQQRIATGWARRKNAFPTRLPIVDGAS